MRTMNPQAPLQSQGIHFSGGTSLPIVGKALGHKTSQATSIYARLNLDPVRAAMESAIEAMNRNRKKTF